MTSLTSYSCAWSLSLAESSRTTMCRPRPPRCGQRFRQEAAAASAAGAAQWQPGHSRTAISSPSASAGRATPVNFVTTRCECGPPNPCTTVQLHAAKYWKTTSLDHHGSSLLRSCVAEQGCSASRHAASCSTAAQHHRGKAEQAAWSQHWCGLAAPAVQHGPCLDSAAACLASGPHCSGAWPWPPSSRAQPACRK
jgi:hypothetical protein